MDKSWLDAIKKALSVSAQPLHYTEISEHILSRGYYKTDGAIPAATVNAYITSSIKSDGDESPFVRAGRGTYSLKNITLPAQAHIIETQSLEQISDVEVEASDTIVNSFGMYWQRDLVVWRNGPRVFGKQQRASKSVDFGKQKGIYILYDQHTVIYVGRSIDRPLGKRLYEHTTDRLSSRWNRFSWFGLLDVTHEGTLRDVLVSVSLAALVATLEALLIEALEPPQNRQAWLMIFLLSNTYRILTPN